jgi:WD40 repeat protein
VVVLWNTKHQTIDSQWDTGNRVRTLSISHDAQLIASCGVDSIRIWTRKEMAVIHTVTVDRASMLSRLSITRDGRHAAWESREDDQAFLTFSDVANGRAVDCVAIHGNYHVRLHLTDDSRQLIASHGLSTVAIWELELNKTQEEIYQARTSPSDLLYSVFLGSQQYIVSLDSSGGVGGYLENHSARLWNPQTGQIDAAFVSAVIPKVRSASNVISFIGEDGIYLLDPKYPEPSVERCVTKGRFQSYCFSHDGSLLPTISSKDEKRTVAVWNVSDEVGVHGFRSRK